MALSEAKLRELIAADEGQYHDLKSLFEGPPAQKRPRDRRSVRDQIAEQVAGFANADGGVVIFGVEDDHAITGHSYPPDVVDQMLLVPQTRLVPPQPAGYRVTLDGIELLAFEVESAPRAVMVQGDGFPYRISDTTPQFSEEKINTTRASASSESPELSASQARVTTSTSSRVSKATSPRFCRGLARCSRP